MLIFRQLLDPQSSTYAYLLGDDERHQAVLIDPVFEQVGRDAALQDNISLMSASGRLRTNDQRDGTSAFPYQLL